MADESPVVVDPEVFRREGFDPAASRGLFVGVSEFEDAKLGKVPYAVDDAVDLAFLFTEELGLLHPEHTVLALAGEPRKPASRERLAGLLGQGARRVSARQRDIYDYVGAQGKASGPRGLFVVAIATHGFVAESGGYLAAPETHTAYAQRTGVAVEELYDLVGRAVAPRRLVLLDACRNRLRRGAREVAEPGLETSFAKALAQAKGQVVLQGATLGGYAYDDDATENGVFSGAVLRGLRGEAKGDEQAGGWITARTLAEFVDQEVRSWVGREYPQDAAESLGIGKRVEGPAEALPLAANLSRKRYQERRAKGKARLQANEGEVLTEERIAAILRRLPKSEPTPEAEELLGEIEALDGSVRSQRALLGFLLQTEKEPATVHPSPPAPPVPPVVVTKPPPVVVQLPAPELVVPKSNHPPGGAARKPRRWWWLVALGLGGVVVAVAAVLYLMPTQEPATAIKPREEPQPQAPQVPLPAAGTLATSKSGMRFHYVPAGTYTVGSPPGEPGQNDNETRHQVKLTRGFWLGETEVTQGQWMAMGLKNPSRYSACGANCPVEQVNWYEAVTFANRLSEREGVASCYELSGCTGTLGTEGYACTGVRFKGLDCAGYRLPTEHEWEVAARADPEAKAAIYGAKLEDIAWFGENSGGRTHAVGGRQGNQWGFEDMLGNVFEWTGDGSGDPYTGVLTDPLGNEQGTNRVVRGGSWGSLARYVRAACRGGNHPSIRGNYLGFRLARGQAAALQPEGGAPR